jgi:hypothetical protein
MGFIGWSIGRTHTVVEQVAATLGLPIRSVAGILSHLIAGGWLSNDFWTDLYWVDTPGYLGVTHEGWQA